MKSSILREIQKSRKDSATGIESRSVHWLIPFILVLATWAAFLPTLSNDFVVWDDEETLLANPYFRGLSWSHLSWMFTTFHMGHYQPLSWLTFGLDYAVWGMNPFGYHLTNLLLHSGNALSCYFVALRLLSLAFPEVSRQRSWPLALSAAFAALCFAIHPLRVESVAWATERRDVLSGLFYLWAIYAYLRAQDIAGDGSSRRWLAATWFLYLLSLLSKATAMTFPLVLVLLDIYPLRRLSWSIRQWPAPQARNVWREKVPFFFLALFFAATAVFSQQQSAALKNLESYGIGPRLAQALFGMGFYLWKTVAPARLSPLYEIPPNYSFWDPLSLVSGLAALVISCCLFLARDRWPAGLACWLYYLTLLAPVLGLAQSGPQLVADRYSYLSCLSWAILAGGILLFLSQRAGREPRRFHLAAMGAGALAITLALAFLTWRQCFIWRDAETLWAHVIKTDPDGSYGHYNLAREIARKGRYQEAMRHYREALRIRPDDADSHNNLGLLLALTGQFDRSLAELQRAVEVDPRYAKGYFNLGRVLARRGDFEGAAKNLRKALQLKSDQVEIHLALGAVLIRQGRPVEAGERFKEAIRVRPDSADAHTALARWLAGQSEKEQAAKHYEEALRLIKVQAQHPASRVPAGGEEFSGADKATDFPIK
jgi:Tfp pilus assembly protein PilF